MAHLIDKDEVLAIIENRIRACGNCYILEELTSLHRTFDSLEVKEVDLDFMLHEYWNISPKICVDCLESVTMTKDEMIKFAKHFFELGMAVSNKAQKGE